MLWIKIILFVNLLGLLCAQTTSDMTKSEGATGIDVVFATVARIRESGVFSDDDRFLRRVAFAESRDGTAPDTFREGYNGGIWQVDEAILQKTQDVNLHPELIANGGIYQRLAGSSLSVDWSAATWQDLRAPLFSGLAARIYFELTYSDIPPIGDVRTQGKFWKSSGFNNNIPDTVESFVEAITTLELEECPNRGIDLAFVLDSSGSVGKKNFGLEKELVGNIVDRFLIGPEATQVAVISYSSFAVINFLLTTQEDIQTAVDNVQYFNIPVHYRGPSTNTADALKRLRMEVFSTENGARTSDLGIPRVAVVITDGQSNINASQTIPAAKALKEEGTTVFSVGVGKNIRLMELEAIASSPENVMLLEQGFDVTGFDGLRSRITADACVATVPVDIGQILNIRLTEGQVSFFEFELPEEGMTISLRRQEGRMTLYASDKLQNPNPAFYDYRIVNEGEIYVDIDSSKPIIIKREQPAEIILNVTTLYMSVKGTGETNDFKIYTYKGDTTSGGGRIISSLPFLSLTSCWHALFLVLLIFHHY